MTKHGITLYNSILRGERAADSLCEEEKRLVFAYLCRELEQGNEVDRGILEQCASAVDVSHISDADSIIESTYKRLAVSEPRDRCFVPRHILRRLFAAAIAVFTFVVFTFVTASAFGIDVVEQIKTIFEDESTAQQTKKIRFEASDGRTAFYKDLEELFEARLPGYLYPTRFPEGVEPTLVTENKDESGILFTLKMKYDIGESWIMTAKPENESYLPMGYKYKNENDADGIEFVYTLSRNSGGITQYNVYAVHNGVLYTFYLHTGNWDDAKIILDSFGV